MPREELRNRQIDTVLGHIAAYARAGHRLTFERRHGQRPGDNEIVFRIADWAAFVEVMEPGHPVARGAESAAHADGVSLRAG